MSLVQDILLAAEAVDVLPVRDSTVKLVGEVAHIFRSPCVLPRLTPFNLYDSARPCVGVPKPPEPTLFGD